MSKKAKKVTIKGLNSYHKRNAKGEVVKDKQGKPIIAWKFRFTDKEGVRRTIYLGEGVPNRDATFYAENLSRIVQCSKTPGSVLPPEVQAFVDGIDYSFRKKLIEVKLIGETERDIYETAATIGTLTDAYLEFCKDGGENTVKNKRLAVTKIVAYFGRDQKVCDLSVLDLKQFEDHLYKNNAFASASRFAGRTREICWFGVRSKILTREFYDERFEDTKLLQRKDESNKERQQSVPIKTYAKIVAASDSPEFRFSLFFARFLACRVPSECKAFRWSYISFTDKRVKVWDVKRKRIRIVALFPHLLPFIGKLLHHYQCDSFIKDVQAAGLSFKYDSMEIIKLLRDEGDSYIAEMASRFPKDEDFVFSEKYRSRKGQGKRLKDTLKRAKVILQKPFVNMRGACESEWIVDFGLKAACEWTGNSMVVAEKHYARIPPEIWAKATGDTSEKQDLDTIRFLIGKHGVDGVQDLIAKAYSKDRMGDESEIQLF